MEQIKYGEFIANAIKNMPFESAILTEDIAERLVKQFALPYAQAKTLTNVKLKRMADSDEIERLQKGVYCQVKESAFGKVTPDIDKVIMKTLTVHRGAKIGYESGAFLLNKLGLTTLIPRCINITTNQYRTKLPDRCYIKTRRPPAMVTNHNWKYLQFIDVVNELPNAHIDAEKPEQLLVEYFQKQQLDSLTLVFTARRYYAKEVVLRLIDMLLIIDPIQY